VGWAQHVFFFHSLILLVISMLTPFILMLFFHPSIFLRATSARVPIHIQTHHSFRYVTSIPPHNMAIPSHPIASHFLRHWRATIKLSLIYLFLILSILVTPHIHLNIHISVTCSFPHPSFHLPSTPVKHSSVKIKYMMA
jgi:hypothetical protein